MIDIHCHLLPGIDDGPRNWEESTDLCRAMVEDGITRAITTPHLIDGVYENTLQVTRPLVAELRQRLGDAGIDLDVEAAAEIDISSRFVSGDSSGMPTLCGSAALLEMPVAVIPHAMEQILFAVRSRGLLPVLAHPERNHLVQENPDVVTAWVQLGAVLQIDAESLLGLWGKGSQRCAEKLLMNGVVAAVSSDSHSCRKRPPRMTAAAARTRILLGDFAAHMFTVTPAAILSGQFRELPHLEIGSTRTRSLLGRLWKR
ncbi:MAG TPA: CpsB/CapC family capsule biosynthesis tyrosine phosphatase [Candidatus Binatia bacterium]|nr:CpsB/CapC family capsule biosynthesis tyrosine phosphatase [Candidatus Binatia bacterium]